MLRLLQSSVLLLALAGSLAPQSPVSLVAYLKDGTKPPLLKNSAIVEDSMQSLLNQFPQVTQNHAEFANRVLMIRTTGIVDHADFQHITLRGDGSAKLSRAPWGFPAILRRSFQMMGISGEGPMLTAFENWAGDVDASIPTQWRNLSPRAPAQTGDPRTLDSVPVRLLAVVNRLDLAALGADKPADSYSVACAPSMMCGGEFRFVYGNLTDAHQAGRFSLILEFQLPPLSKPDFLALAGEWYNLPPLASSDYRTKLEGILEHSFRLLNNKSLIRIRANYGTGPWSFVEYHLTGRGLQRFPLDREPNPRPSDSPALAAPMTPCVQPGSLMNFVIAHTQKVLLSNYSFPETACPATHIGACQVSVLKEHPTALTLPAGATFTPPATVDDVRFALSINTCSGCHGAETRTNAMIRDPEFNFEQVQNRAPGAQSKLSPFLAGGVAGEPTTDLYEMKAALCGGAVAGSRKFNDLLRRHLFMLAVMGLGQAQPALAQAGPLQDAAWHIVLVQTGLTTWQKD